MRQVTVRPVQSRLFRTWLQDKFFDAGTNINKHAGKVLFCGLLALIAGCAALKSAAIETRVDKLWVAGEYCSSIPLLLTPFLLMSAQRMAGWRKSCST